MKKVLSVLVFALAAGGAMARDCESSQAKPSWVQDLILADSDYAVYHYYNDRVIVREIPDDDKWEAADNIIIENAAAKGVIERYYKGEGDIGGGGTVEYKGEYSVRYSNGGDTTDVTEVYGAVNIKGRLGRHNRHISMLSEGFYAEVKVMSGRGRTEEQAYEQATLEWETSRASERDKYVERCSGIYYVYFWTSSATVPLEVQKIRKELNKPLRHTILNYEHLVKSYSQSQSHRIKHK